MDLNSFVLLIQANNTKQPKLAINCFVEKDIFITVVIPTLNRAHTIADTIQSCIAQDIECEFLVSDNCSEDDTTDLVNSFDDKRIRYVRTNKTLSMERSFDFALSQCRAGYIYTIGADDALFPGGLRRLVDTIKLTQALVIRPKLTSYYWSNYPDPTHQGVALNISISNNWRWVESADFLRETAKDLSNFTYFYENMPALYHGCVHSSVISQDWPTRQAIIQSKQPDMYTGVLIASKIPRYVVMDGLVSLNAMSRSSNSVSGFLKKDVDACESVLFRNSPDYPYDPSLIQDSSTIDIGMCIPILLADQFLKVDKLGYKIPQISIKALIESSLRAACKWQTEDQYEGALRMIRSLAEINNLGPYTEKKIAKYRFKKKIRTRRSTEYNPLTREYRVLDLASFDVTGAHSACVVIDELTKTHARQDTLKLGTNQSPPRSASIRQGGSFSNLYFWLLIRSRPHCLKGNLLILDNCESEFLRSIFSNPPSLATKVTIQNTELVDSKSKFDTILSHRELKPKEKELLLASLSECGNLIIISTILTKPEPIPGWSVSSEQLALTNDELLLVALLEWSLAYKGNRLFKLIFNLSAAFIIFLIKRRLEHSRSMVKLSGLTLEKWSKALN